MKALFKFAFILGAFFTFTLVVFKLLDLFTVDDIRSWLEFAQELSIWHIALIIIGLMAIDLFVAIPTLSLSILSGFFLGMELGAFVSSLGMMSAGSLGYFLSRHYGEKILVSISSDAQQRAEMTTLFIKHGVFSLLLCRAAPMLPEIASCLAGITRMSFLRYLLFFGLGTVPYSLIAAYAGSVSTVDNPQPAIYAFLGIFGGLTLIWLGFLQYQRLKAKKENKTN